MRAIGRVRATFVSVACEGDAHLVQQRLSGQGIFPSQKRAVSVAAALQGTDCDESGFSLPQQRARHLVQRRTRYTSGFLQQNDIGCDSFQIRRLRGVKKGNPVSAFGRVKELQ